MIKKEGFIIPVTLMLISVAVVLVTYIYQRGSLFVPYQTTMIDREQARHLALAGVEVARAQLAVGQEKEQAKDKPGAGSAAPAQQDSGKSFLEKILPKLNVWQKFPLKKQIDGINGDITILIASESGKINVNEIYDFSKKAVKDSWKNVLPDLFKRIGTQSSESESLYKAFENFLKERHAKLNDATELVRIKQFKSFASYLFPALPLDKKDKKYLYLLDIFTVYGKKDTIQPWLFSASIMQLLNLKQPLVLSNEIIQTLLKSFKPSINWNQDWVTIGKPRYGIELTQLPKGIEATFDTTFDPSYFSVVSYGKVGNVTQKIYAIVERSEHTVEKKKVIDVMIKKLYWI